MRESSLKEQHEIAIGNALLRELKLDAQWIRHGVDGVEPDLIYQLAGKKVGIEITTAYYDEHQARVEWQLARGELRPDRNGFAYIKKPREWTGEPYKLIAASVQRKLDVKCSKSYSGVDAAWLCIEQHAQLADVSETLEMILHLRISAGHPFERIYLAMYAHVGDGGGFRVYDLLST